MGKMRVAKMRVGNLQVSLRITHASMLVNCESNCEWFFSQ